MLKSSTVRINFKEVFHNMFGKNSSALEIQKVLNNSKKPICIADSRFDFDAFGSALALYEYFKANNVRLDVYWHSELPETFTKIVPNHPVVTNTDYSKIDFSKYDLLVLADSSSVDHIGKDGTIFEMPKNIESVCFDHHETNLFYATYNYVVKDLCSTCSVLGKFLTEIDFRIKNPMASYLVYGIVTDSGTFQYNSVKPFDLRLVADLMDAGANLFNFIWQLTFNVPLSSFQMSGIVYRNIRYGKNKKYAYTEIKLKELEKYGIDKQFADMFRGSDRIKELEGVEFVFSIKEDSENKDTYKVSYRAHNPDFDVSLIAAKLGGGGHKAAAGATITTNGGISKAIKIIEETIEEVYPDL